LRHLPALHRDPFDRLLVAQAKIEALAVVTSDPVFARYQVPVIST
jgi:PIN domain nuclease of toxin-antitoxin system